MSNETNPYEPVGVSVVGVPALAGIPPEGDTPTLPLVPVAEKERYAALDVLRGLALFGVLIVNIETCFRVSLAEYVLMSHTYERTSDQVAHWLITTVLQFKAFTLFSISFGIGVAVQSGRAARRKKGFELLLARRSLVLLAIGLCHMFLIWTGDILCLYAVCGLLLLPVLRLPVYVLAPAGVVAIVLNFVISFDRLLPSWEFYVTHAAQATETYANGSFVEIMRFRWREALTFDIPILLTVVLKTYGLMLLGISAWRSGVLREPERWCWVLLLCLLVGGAIGVTAMVLPWYTPSVLLLVSLSPEDWQAVSYISLALAYLSAVFLVFGSRGLASVARPLAAVGQMALTNYLTQSIILGFIFYGYGLGYFGRLGPATTALIGIALYIAQAILSFVWLCYFQFGPVEWVWRSLTYGRPQPIWREAATLV